MVRVQVGISRSLDAENVPLRITGAWVRSSWRWVRCGSACRLRSCSESSRCPPEHVAVDSKADNAHYVGLEFATPAPARGMRTPEPDRREHGGVASTGTKNEPISTADGLTLVGELAPLTLFRDRLRGHPSVLTCSDVPVTATAKLAVPVRSRSPAPPPGPVQGRVSCFSKSALDGPANRSSHVAWCSRKTRDASLSPARVGRGSL